MKRRILHLIPSFHQGGSESQALQLAGLLASEGSYEVLVACLDRKGVLLRQAESMGFEDIPEFPLTSFYDLNMARQLRRFVTFLRSNRIEIIQSHDFYSNIFGMVGARIAGVPVRIAAKRETGMRNRAQLFVERRSLALATTIVANSESVRNYLIESGVPQKKIAVVHNGTDLGRFKDPLKDRCGLLKEMGIFVDCPTRLVTVVANLRDPVKNHRMFLHAAAEISGKVDDVAFVIAGEGELLEEMRSLSSDLAISDRTVFTGRCGRVPELLAASTICALTSDSEGFSNSILEYMAAGRPVVATAVGGAAEAVIDGETGFLVEPGDHAALAGRICTLLNDPALCESMGRKGRIRVLERFSTEAQIAGSLTVYDRSLKSAGLR